MPTSPGSPLAAPTARTVSARTLDVTGVAPAYRTGGTVTVPMPRPPLLPLLAAIPQPRRLMAHRASNLTFDAVCPHGRDAVWVASRADERSRSECRCTCPEVAA